MVIKKKDLKEMLFVDIETVSEQPAYDQVPSELRAVWAKKAARLLRIPDGEELAHTDIAAAYDDKAGIFAEFAKVACITVGYLTKVKRGQQPILRIKTFAGHDEGAVLGDFCKLMDQHFDDPTSNYLCGHNIKEFDVPFLCRRLVIHGMRLPRLLNIAGKKPWQVQHLVDTMVLWRFGDYKNYTSLALLAATLRIPSPKDDIDGSQVGSVYWKDDDLDRIVTYCEKDVITVAQIAMRYAGAPLIPADKIEIIHPEIRKRDE